MSNERINTQLPLAERVEPSVAKAPVRENRRLRAKTVVVVEGQECALLPLPKGKFAIVDSDMFDFLNQWNWRLADGYVISCRDRIKLHQMISKAPVGLVTDHENRNKLDNRSRNLRWATNAENCRNNTRKSRPKVSGFKGVYWHKQARLFYVKVRILGRFISCGCYENAEDARAVYAFEAKRLHGEFYAP